MSQGTRISTPLTRYPSLTEQKRYWETKWRDPKSVNECGTTGHWSHKRAETILQFLRSLNIENPAILDFGCGTGWFTEILSHFGPAIGIDLSESAIATAKSRYPHATFIAGDLFEAPLPGEHFDVVVSQEVIAHVKDQVAYLDRAAHTLKPGGTLIITTPNKFVMDRVDFGPQPFGHIEHWLTLRQLKCLLRPHFHILKTTSILLMGDRGILRLINSHKLNKLVGFIISQRHLEALKEATRLGYTLIVLAQKRRP